MIKQDEENLKKIILELKTNMCECEKNLKEYASRSCDATRLKKDNSSSEIRNEYEIDADRIIHSSAYTRYMGKTQVYTMPLNENISSRATHVQFVSKAARTIARALKLNEDLCEAIALGHDLGHVPFGHTGEKILDEISRKELGECFNHNIQSVRVLKDIEGKDGLNISIQVLDGIMCHNGEFVMDKYFPMNKDKKEFLREYEQVYKMPECNEKLIPMTLEGCIVRISDVIAYIGKDVDDATRLNKFDKQDLSKEVTSILGNRNGEIMNNIIMDVIINSYGKKYICMSPEVFKAVVKLKKQNSEKIYAKALTTSKLAKYTKIFNELYYVYLNALTKKDTKNSIYTFLQERSENYMNNTCNKRKVIDYIACMTDKTIIREYEKYCKK